jgi:hypothetical protein
MEPDEVGAEDGIEFRPQGLHQFDWRAILAFHDARFRVGASGVNRPLVNSQTRLHA